jgi:ATP-binding cassette subfamily F protein 3
VYDYPGNYSWFLEKREELLKKQDDPAGTRPEKKGGGRGAAKGEEKKEEKKRVPGKPGKELAALEAGIARQEARREEIDALLCLPEVFSDPPRARALAREREELEETLSAAYRRWEELVC